MAAGARVLLTWFGSSTSITRLLVPHVRGYLTRSCFAFTRSGEVWFTACAVVRPGSDGINRSGSRWFESSLVSFFFEGGLLWRFTVNRRRDPELESATAFLLCLSLLCGTFVDCWFFFFCIFTTAYATSRPLWEIQRELEKLFAARSWDCSCLRQYTVDIHRQFLRLEVDFFERGGSVWFQIFEFCCLSAQWTRSGAFKTRQGHLKLQFFFQETPKSELHLRGIEKWTVILCHHATSFHTSSRIFKPEPEGGTVIDLGSSEFHSKDAAGGNDSVPYPHHRDVCVRPGPGFQGCVRPLRRLLEPNQPQVGNPSARFPTGTHRRTGAASARSRRRTSPLTLPGWRCTPNRFPL